MNLKAKISYKNITIICKIASVWSDHSIKLFVIMATMQKLKEINSIGREFIVCIIKGWWKKDRLQNTTEWVQVSVSDGLVCKVVVLATIEETKWTEGMKGKKGNKENEWKEIKGLKERRKEQREKKGIQEKKEEKEQTLRK